MSNISSSGEEDAPSTEASHHDMAYSATKAISERIVLAANKANGRLLTCAIRPGFIFGEKDKWLIKEIKQLALQFGLRKFSQWKDKKVSFVHMENVIDALLLAEEKLVEDSHIAGMFSTILFLSSRPSLFYYEPRATQFFGGHL